MSKSEHSNSDIAPDRPASRNNGVGLNFDIRLTSSRQQPKEKSRQKSPIDRVFDKHFAQVRDALELLEAYVVPDHISKFDSVQRIIDESVFQAKRDAGRLFGQHQSSNGSISPDGIAPGATNGGNE